MCVVVFSARPTANRTKFQFPVYILAEDVVGQADTGRCCMADAYYQDHHAKDLPWWPNLPLHLGTRGPFSHLSQETKTYLWVCNHTSGNLGKYPLKMSRPGI